MIREITVRCVFRLMCGALLTVIVSSYFPQPLCTAQLDAQLPGGEKYKEMRIVDGERMEILHGRPRSLEEHVQLQLIATSEEEEDVTVNADKIEFFYDEESEELDRVVASGSVSFMMETSGRQLQADEAIWFAADNRAEFRGNPTVTDERGTFTGDSVVYHVSDDLIVVTKPRAVFLIPEKEQADEETDEKNGRTSEEGSPELGAP
jgi:hypothetical protein